MPSSITTSVGIGGATSTLTSGSISPSGSNRLMLAAASGQTAATDVKSGGSGGTSLTKINTNVSIFSGNYTFNVWSLSPGPTGSTTAWVDFGSAGANSLGVIYLDGVSSLGTEQTAGPTTVSTVSSTVASITVTGLTSGQRVVAALGIGQIPDGITSVTAGANTTVYGFATGDSGERHAGAPWLTGVATGTSLTLSATIALPNIFNDVSWAISAWPVTDSSDGVTGTIARTNANDTSAASGTTTVTGTAARTNANDTMAASGSSGLAVSGTIARTNNNDTSVSSGTTTIRGTLARTNVGDTSAIVAFTTVLGTIGTSSRNDIMTASGYPGTLTITNIWRRLTVAVRSSL